MPFRIALSGLNAASTELSVTGNNISNAGTTGFKRSRAEFTDVFPLSYEGTTSKTPGAGVRLAQLKQLFTQGNTAYTDRSLDMAISGEGFFTLNDNGQFVYSRAGSFGVNKDGYVVNANNQILQMYPPVGNSSTNFNTGILQDMQLSSSTVGSPAATTTITNVLNVDATETAFTVTAVGDNTSMPMSPLNPATYHYSTSINVYDSLGTTHTATMYYRKIDTAAGALPNTWQTFLFVDGTEVPPSGGVPGSGYVPAQASGDPAIIRFNADGSLSSVSPVGTTAESIAYASYAPGNGASNVTLEINYADMSQYGTASAVSSLRQDGYATGRFTDVSLEDDGAVFARFSNGVSQVIGKVALATFTNPHGLQQLGDSGWAASYRSGDPTYGEPNTGRFGTLVSGALEASNVNISTELVNLITAQRSFQANAQVISTADAVTQTIINIR